MHREPSPERGRSHGTDPSRERRALRVEIGHGRRLLTVLFVVYLILLTWLILWKLEVPWIGDSKLRRLKPIPFAPHDGTDFNTPREVLANCLFFVPFGLYLGLLAPAWRWWRPALVFAGTSLLLEVAQFALAIGTSDVTDVITNTAGGIVGFAAAVQLRRRLRGRALTVMGRVCLICTVLLVLAVTAFVASPLHYAPQTQRLLLG